MNKKNLWNWLRLDFLMEARTMCLKLGMLWLLVICCLKIVNVPYFQHNLISIGKLTVDSNIEVVFRHNKCIFHSLNSSTILAIRWKSKGLHILNHEDVLHPTSLVYSYSSSQATTTNVTLNPSASHEAISDVSFNILHARLGHMSISKMKSCLLLWPCHDSFCEICVLAKHHKSLFPRSSNRAALIIDLIHINLWGPYKTKSLSFLLLNLSWWPQEMYFDLYASK